MRRSTQPGMGLATLHAKMVSRCIRLHPLCLSGWTVAFGIPRAIVEVRLRNSLVEIGVAGGLVIIRCGSIALLTCPSDQPLDDAFRLQRWRWAM